MRPWRKQFRQGLFRRHRENAEKQRFSRNVISGLKPWQSQSSLVPSPLHPFPDEMPHLHLTALDLPVLFQRSLRLTSDFVTCSTSAYLLGLCTCTEWCGYVLSQYSTDISWSPATWQALYLVLRTKQWAKRSMVALPWSLPGSMEGETEWATRPWRCEWCWVGGRRFYEQHGKSTLSEMTAVPCSTQTLILGIFGPKSHILCEPHNPE